MPYTTYYLRAPSIKTFLDDLKAVLKEAGFSDDEIENRGIIVEDVEGNEILGNNFDVIPAGAWWITEPERDEDGNITKEGTIGDYVLINVNVNDPEMKELIKSFTTLDASKKPSNIPNPRKVGDGSHRVDRDTINSPERRFA